MEQSVAIIGLGYVGLPLAVQTALKGYSVTGIDLDEQKTADMQRGVSPITDEFVEENLKKGLITVGMDISAVDTADIIIVCVPTPVKNDYKPELGPLTDAVRSVAGHLKKGALLIIESTINPGVSDEIVLPLMEKEFGLEPGKDFYLSHCPERINPGDSYWDVTNIPRVAGSFDKTGLDKTVAFYESIVDAVIEPMGSLKEAEAVKVVENSFRDINIAFVNELAMSFNTLGINVVNVINGAATKPFAFMAHYPGAGVGGHCIPVDPYYLIEYARSYGFDHDFLTLARTINKRMPEFTIDQLIDGLNEAGLALSQSRVVVLGLSYKPNVGDDRESPSYALIRFLKEKHAQVKTYDPYMLQASSSQSLEEALENTDAVVLATAHKEFTELIPEKMGTHVKVLVDGRNCFSKDKIIKAGIIYRGIGV